MSQPLPHSTNLLAALMAGDSTALVAFHGLLQSFQTAAGASARLLATDGSVGSTYACTLPPAVQATADSLLQELADESAAGTQPGADERTSVVATTATVAVASIVISAVALLLLALRAGRMVATPASVVAVAEPAAAASWKQQAPVGSAQTRWYTRLHSALRQIDAFPLLHPIPEGGSPVKHSTARGGCWTWLGAVVAVNLIALLIIQREADNAQSTTKIVGVTSALTTDVMSNTAQAVSRRPEVSAALGSGAALRLDLLAAGDGDGACANVLWSSSGLLAGSFIKLEDSASVEQASCAAAGGASVHSWMCDNCLLDSGTTLSISLPWSCQSLALRLVAVAADGSASVVAAAPALESNATDGSLLSSVRWEAPAMLTLRTDALVSTKTASRTRGYQLLAPTLQTVAIPPAAPLRPASTRVAISIGLPPSVIASHVKVSQRVTLMQLLSSIAGIAGTFALFGRGSQLSASLLSWLQKRRELRRLTKQPVRRATLKRPAGGSTVSVELSATVGDVPASSTFPVLSESAGAKLSPGQPDPPPPATHISAALAALAPGSMPQQRRLSTANGGAAVTAARKSVAQPAAMVARGFVADLDGFDDEAAPKMQFPPSRGRRNVGRPSAASVAFSPNVSSTAPVSSVRSGRFGVVNPLLDT